MKKSKKIIQISMNHLEEKNLIVFLDFVLEKAPDENLANYDPLKAVVLLNSLMPDGKELFGLVPEPIRQLHGTQDCWPFQFLQTWAEPSRTVSVNFLTTEPPRQILNVKPLTGVYGIAYKYERLPVQLNQKAAPSFPWLHKHPLADQPATMRIAEIDTVRLGYCIRIVRRQIAGWLRIIREGALNALLTSLSELEIVDSMDPHHRIVFEFIKTNGPITGEALCQDETLRNQLAEIGRKMSYRTFMKSYRPLLELNGMKNKHNRLGYFIDR